MDKPTHNFASKQEVRWCPGCGDYAILSAMQRFLKSSDIAPENIVFVSGIGCNGRFPYYMNTFGFHTIHGRGPAVATGIKLANPKLSVWLITGDGDGLSIGASHFIHLLRRNLDINVLLFNNQIYGLTKGQFSPTSVIGQKTKTSPEGVISEPLSPLKLALAANGSFIARGLDKEPKHLMTLFKQAYEHQGTSLIEIYQNCPVFNDDAFQDIDDKKVRQDKILYLEEDKPFTYGANKDKQLFLDNDKLVAGELKEGETIAHQLSDYMMAQRLLSLDANAPLPLGVFYQRNSKAQRSVDNGCLDEQSLAELF